MIVVYTYRFRLYPDEKQQQFLNIQFGHCRNVFQWAVYETFNCEAGISPTLLESGSLIGFLYKILYSLCISFSGNVKIISGPPTSGNDLTAGVTKIWIVEVTNNSNVQGIKASSVPTFPVLKE